MAAAIAALSPRLSFSHDIDLSPLPPPPPADDVGGAEDFDFSVSQELSSFQEPSPADELFSHGKLLPLSSSLKPSSSSSSATIRHPPVLENNRQSRPIPSADGGNIGRSSSVGAGTGKSRLSSICPFPRSKSTGSYQTQKRTSPVTKKSQSQSTSTRSWYSYYYSGSSRRSSSSSGNGVRISPVINVPAPFIPRGGSSGGSSSGSSGGSGGGNSFFAYLLCNCRDKSSRGLENFSL